MLNQYSKADQLAYHNKRKAQKIAAKGSKAVGNAAENMAIDELCEQMGRTRGKKDRRNNQTREGGGAGIPDISVEALNDWFFESKCEKDFTWKDYQRQLKRDCPKNRRGGIIYRESLESEAWVIIRMTDIQNFAQDVVYGSGCDIVHPWGRA